MASHSFYIVHNVGLHLQSTNYCSSPLCIKLKVIPLQSNSTNAVSVVVNTAVYAAHSATKCGIYNDADCIGCSGKAGFCCLNLAFCCKAGAPCLPLCCCGPTCECDGCSIFNAQFQCMNVVVSAALPCNQEVPIAVSILGLTVFPKCGCCVSIKDIKMDR